MKTYDRAAEDLGNLVHLEHFNCTIDDQRLAVLFYVVGLGATRDPYIFTGLENIWLNFGRTQVHMPSRAMPPRTQRLRGTAGFVVPSLADLKKRLEYAAGELKRVVPERETRFAWKEGDGCIEATDPWGTRVRCHPPSPEFGRTELGLVYVDFDVPPGTAEGIARFYREVMRARSIAKGGRASVSVGVNQKLHFTETGAPLPEYDGHHIQVYLADFSGPYEWLKARELITLETDAHEWRFQWIVDPADGRRLFQIEHEVRSMKHPLFARPLVNRNPGLTNVNYVPGADGFRGAF